MVSTVVPEPHKCDFCQQIMLAYCDGEAELSAGAERCLAKLVALYPTMEIDEEQEKLRRSGVVISDLTFIDIQAAANDGCLLAVSLEKGWSYANMDSEWSRGKGDIIHFEPLTLATRICRGSIKFGVPMIMEGTRIQIGSNKPDKHILVDCCYFPEYSIMAASGTAYNRLTVLIHCLLHRQEIQQAIRSQCDHLALTPSPPPTLIWHVSG